MTAKMIQLLRKNTFIKKRGLVCLLASACAIASLPSYAFNLFGSEDEDAKDKATPEIDWQLPAPPVVENLLPFYVSQKTRQSFAIDTKSLTVDTDGVVRYTIVGTSSAGAKNVSYEGIRCKTFERRIYAMGHDDGTWARARNSEWQPIPVLGGNLQQAELAQNYFCRDGLIAGKVDQILQSIRYHRTGFGQM